MPNPSEKEMWAIFSGDEPIKLMFGPQEDVEYEARKQMAWHSLVSIHRLVTTIESQSAYARGVEDAAKVAEKNVFGDGTHAEWDAACQDVAMLIRLEVAR